MYYVYIMQFYVSVCNKYIFLLCREEYGEMFRLCYGLEKDDLCLK